MKIVVTLLLVLTASLLPTAVSWPSDKPAQRDGADEKDLTGVWDGATQARRDDDWGVVNVKATEDGYLGTWSDTNNGQLGSLTFKRIGERKYKGLWWESDLKHYGSFELEGSKDGQSITVTWKSLDKRATGETSGKSVWKRTAKPKSS